MGTETPRTASASHRSSQFGSDDANFATALCILVSISYPCQDQPFTPAIVSGTTRTLAFQVPRGTFIYLSDGRHPLEPSLPRKAFYPYSGGNAIPLMELYFPAPCFNGARTGIKQDCQYGTLSALSCIPAAAYHPYISIS